MSTTAEAPPEPEQKPDTFLSAFVRNLWSANTVTVTILSIVLALVISAVLVVVSDSHVLSMYSYFTSRPSDALSASWGLVSNAYYDLFKGAVFEKRIEQLTTRPKEAV